MLQRVETQAAGLAPAAPVSKSKYRMIAIMGSHPVTKMRAPFDDPSVLIYSCSPDNSPYGSGEGAGVLPRVDEMFEVHIPIEHPTRPFKYLNWLSKQPFVWLRDKDALKHFPGGRMYPDEEMRGRKIIYPDGRVEFTPGEFIRSQFKSSIAFMMARAIKVCQEQNIPAIGLWGILQRGKQEFELQRASTQYFIETAQLRGIDVSVSPESMLMHDDPELF